MKAFVIFAVALIAVVSASHQRHSKPGQPDYFWKEYDGTIPRGAVKVGQAGSDVPVYIGQGYFEGVGLLPGMIKDGVMELSAVANGRIYTIKENIKIMASHSDDTDRDFQWISINYQNFESLRKLNFIKLLNGGSESGTTVFVGRYSEPNYTNIGKIYTLEPYQGLTIPDAQGAIKVYKNFQVLVRLNFDCSQDETRGAFNQDETRSAYFNQDETRSVFNQDETRNALEESSENSGYLPPQHYPRN